MCRLLSRPSACVKDTMLNLNRPRTRNYPKDVSSPSCGRPSACSDVTICAHSDPMQGKLKQIDRIAVHAICNGSASTPCDQCDSLRKRAALTILRRNHYEEAFAFRDGNNLFCCPSAYRRRAIGLRWFLGSHLRDATRRMRSHLQLHRQYF